jgi:hypothetical protein
MIMADRVSEAAPVQVYLDRQSRDRLERLAGSTGATKSDILRRGLLALERELTDPGSHPALRLIGIAAAEAPGVGYDVAREHDRYLAAQHERESPPLRPTRKRPKRG